MLKAYDYTERSLFSSHMHDDELFRREKQIAMKYVVANPSVGKNIGCPICKEENTRYIFARWDINYRICNRCKSIFATVDKDVISSYLELDELRDFRASKSFQSSMEAHRQRYWDEFVSWLKFRTYRYLGRNRNLAILDVGNKYEGLVRRMMRADDSWIYELSESCLMIDTKRVEDADVLLYLNQLQHEYDPVFSLIGIGKRLRKGGLLILNTRLGSGFDILTLKSGAEDIFPYEHITLPSKNGLEIALQQAGFELLEITTPGTRDMEIVLKNRERIEEENFFVRYLLEMADERIISDFQQFLQKSGLSSFAQIVAIKKGSTENA